MKYRANRATNEMMDALPASFVSLARVEITTAPSMPMNTHTVVNMQAFVCSNTDIPLPSPVKLFMNVSKSNAPAKIAAKTRNTIGIALNITATALIITAWFTPLSRSRTSSHRITEPMISDARFMPSPRNGSSSDSEPRNPVENVTYARIAESQ